MSHRRAYDPKAPNRPIAHGDEPAAVEPQEAPESEGAQEPPVEPSGQEEPQEPGEAPDSEDAPPEPPAEEVVSEDDVPENAEDVVAWVGKDHGRARAALAKEAKRGKERKTVAALRSLLED